MTTTNEAILADISTKLGDLTEAYVKLEVTNRTEIKGLREDLADMRSLLRDTTRTQADQGERITMVEAKAESVLVDQLAIARMDTRLSVLETKVEHNAPVRTPWTSIVSAVVAIGALAWTFFGK